MTGPDLEALIRQLLASRNAGSRPPVQLWNPPLSGDIDILITRDGRWIHEGGAIQRTSLVTLFASILKREDDQYFLVTPAEKWRISVEDVPFYVIGLEVIVQDGQQALLFTSSTDDTIVAGEAHPLSVVVDAGTGEPSPYILVRDNMQGRLSRNVYYALADLAEPRQADPEGFDVTSMGVRFPLN